MASRKRVSVKRERHWSSGIFLGCLLIGIALGFVYDQLVVATLLGLGIGCILAAILKKYA